MKSLIVYYNTSIKRLVLIIFVLNLIFIEFIIVRLLFDVKTGIPMDYLCLFLLITFTNVLLFAIAPYRWNDHQAIRISSLGILDASSNVAIGRIQWEDISHIKRHRKGNVDMIKIYLKEPQKFIKRTNPLITLIIWVKWMVWGTPFVISASFYETSINDIYETLMQYTVENGVEMV